MEGAFLENWNKTGDVILEFIMVYDFAIVNTYFKKRK